MLTFSSQVLVSPLEKAVYDFNHTAITLSNEH